MRITTQIVVTKKLCNICLEDHMSGGCGHGFGEGDEEINICHDCYSAERKGAAMPSYGRLMANLASKGKIGDKLVTLRKTALTELRAKNDNAN